MGQAGGPGYRSPPSAAAAGLPGSELGRGQDRGPGSRPQGPGWGPSSLASTSYRFFLSSPAAERAQPALTQGPGTGRGGWGWLPAGSPCSQSGGGTSGSWGATACGRASTSQPRVMGGGGGGPEGSTGAPWVLPAVASLVPGTGAVDPGRDARCCLGCLGSTTLHTLPDPQGGGGGSGLGLPMTGCRAGCWAWQTRATRCRSLPGPLGFCPGASGQQVQALEHALQQPPAVPAARAPWRRL